VGELDGYFVNPAAGVALAVRKIAEKAREEAGLDPAHSEAI